MDELLAGFLAELKDGDRSRFTIDTYRQNLSTFLKWCGAEQVQPIGATTDQLKMYLRRYDNKRTKRLHLAGLRQFYDYLTNDRQLLAADPTRAVDRKGKLLLPLPRIEKRPPRVITDDEKAALFKAARRDLEARVFLRLMRFSGLRVSEVVGHRRTSYDPHTKTMMPFESPGLRICDVDLTRLLIDVRGKGQKEDLGYLDARTAVLIGKLIPTLSHQHPEAPLFQLADGRPKGTKWAFKRFRRLWLDARIPRRLTSHMLRHTFGTRFLEAGGNLRALQRLMRHRNLETTLIYADFVQDGALRREFDAHNVDAEAIATASDVEEPVRRTVREEEAVFGTQN